MKKVGIPRALLYYKYFPMWKAFLEGMGAEVVLSSPTTKRELNQGSSRMVAETCLPVKVFCGHAQSLVGQCDYLFIPSIRSVEPRAYNCSKFLGLPDMIKATLPQAPPILEADIDVTAGQRAFYGAIYQLARPLCWNPLKVKQAAFQALEVHGKYQRQMWQQGLTPPQVLGEKPVEERPENSLTLAVIGHPYLLYDEYINHRLVSRLEGMGVRVLTPEMVPQGEGKKAMAGQEGRAYWTFEEEVVGAAGHYLEQEVAGVVGVAAFGCGPDSLMMDQVKRLARAKRKPFLCLTLDEHTGEAGLITRLEAFLDMMGRQRRCG